MLPREWACDLVGRMHKFGIAQKRLAEHLGVTPEYVSMVLNGRREPAKAEEKFCKAVEELIAEMDVGEEELHES